LAREGPETWTTTSRTDDDDDGRGRRAGQRSLLPDDPKAEQEDVQGETLLEFYEIDDLGNELINLTQGSIPDTQSLILRTYGTDFDTVCRTNILEQGEADYFCKATPAERMALFSQVWDLEKYDEMAQIEKEEVAVIKEKIRTLDETRAACITKLDAVDKDKEELEVLKKTKRDLSRTVENLERKKEKAEKALAKYESLDEQERNSTRDPEDQRRPGKDRGAASVAPDQNSAVREDR